MKLDAEVRHRSEDIQDVVLLDVVKAIRRRVRVINRTYDIPYIAGYNVDGHTVFIDRHLPRSFRWLLKTVRVEPFLLTHEIVEKALARRVAPALPSCTADPGGAGRREGRRSFVVGLSYVHEKT